VRLKADALEYQEEEEGVGSEVRDVAAPAGEEPGKVTMDGP
jgi:hypothetical protein